MTLRDLKRSAEVRGSLPVVGQLQIRVGNQIEQVDPPGNGHVVPVEERSHVCLCLGDGSNHPEWVEYGNDEVGVEIIPSAVLQSAEGNAGVRELPVPPCSLFRVARRPRQDADALSGSSSALISGCR